MISSSVSSTSNDELGETLPMMDRKKQLMSTLINLAAVGDERVNHVMNFVWSNQFYGLPPSTSYMMVEDHRKNRYKIDLEGMPRDVFLQVCDYLCIG